MNKIFIEFNVIDQTVYRTDTQSVVAGSYNVYWARFTFNEAWDGLNKTAVFQVESNNYLAEIDDNGECEVPWEALAAAGTIVVGAMGGNLITTSGAEAIVLSAIAEGDYPAEPTLGLIPAAVDATRAYRDAAAKAAEEAEASQNATATSEANTKNYADSAKNSALDSAGYANTAKEHSESAEASKTAAETAQAGVEAAKADALAYKNDAQGYAGEASLYLTGANQSKNAAAASAEKAAASEANTKSYAEATEAAKNEVQSIRDSITADINEIAEQAVSLIDSALSELTGSGVIS